MGRPRVNISGQRFGKFLVLENTIIKGKSVFWECKCDCGETCFIQSGDLVRGRKNFCPKCNELKSKNTVLNLLYGAYKRGARDRGHEFKITIEEFADLINKNCVYCGVEPKQIFQKKGLAFNIIYNGIDREDNNIGYVLNNCVPACKFCNFAKSQSSLEEFMEWINRLKNK